MTAFSRAIFLNYSKGLQLTLVRTKHIFFQTTVASITYTSQIKKFYVQANDEETYRIHGMSLLAALSMNTETERV